MDVKKYSISDVLSKNNTSFYIPPFQRAYAWRHQEVERFFSDISHIIDSERNNEEQDKREHFFGVLVFKTEKLGFSSREVVVDGQQRLTTTLLMLIALRDSINDIGSKTEIENSFLKNSASTFGDKIKLKQVTSDWNAYRALIMNTAQIPAKVTDVYNWFFSKIEEKDYTFAEYATALSRLNVACVFLDEKPYKGEDPQIIFETLNSLGKPLEFADLIRNFILLGMDSDNQTEIFDKTWHPKIEEVLRENSSHFFRDYLQYKNSTYLKIVNENNTKELYAYFTDFVENKFDNDRQALVCDICRFAPWYKWITEANPNVAISSNANNNKTIIELLRNIFHVIKANAFKPLVLGFLEYHQDGIDGKKLSDDRLIDALTVIRTYLIRRRILRLTQGENKGIARLCNEIYSNESLLLNTTAELFGLLSKVAYRLRIPNDSEINAELRRIDFYNGLSKYSKLILGKIEEYISKVSVDFRDKKITIEHVMPQSVERDDTWKSEIGDDWESVHKSYVHNVGNLILTEFNSEMGNKPLADKKEKLSKSNLLYRNDVLSRTTWNQNDIIAHQSEMVERFLAAFPLPRHMQDANNWDAKIQTTQDVFSPLDDEASDIATNRKPKAIIIDDELFEVKTWQDVYLSFLRWLNENKPIVFDKILDQKEGVFFSSHSLIASRQVLATIVEISPEMKRRYKRLSDGIIYSTLPEDDTGNQIFVFINQSAEYLVWRIRQAMILADMDEEAMVIELQAQR
jgi:uncharacterized protein with ParB-like and HNH nuclease domain